MCDLQIPSVGQCLWILNVLIFVTKSYPCSKNQSVSSDTRLLIFHVLSEFDDVLQANIDTRD